MGTEKCSNQTLFEMDIVEDYSEEKCPIDPTVKHRR